MATNFVNNPSPANTAAQASGGGLLDGLFNFASNTFKSWLEYDSYKFEQDLREQQYLQNPYGYPLGTDEYGNYTGAPATLDSREIILFGIMGLGALLLVKALK